MAGKGSGHTPTRIDIKTSGWTSGMDVLGAGTDTRGCAVGTCHHAQHQLSGARNAVGMDSKWIVETTLSPVSAHVPVPVHAPAREQSWTFGAVKTQPGWTDNELRPFPEFPLSSFHVIRSGLLWQIEIRMHGTEAWQKPPALRFWRRSRADRVRAVMMSHQQSAREEYINRANAR